jgi:hypothetical protein
VTNQGTQFMGDVFKCLCNLLRVHKLNTSAFRPSSNGSLERANITMVEYLRSFYDPRGSDWNKCLPFACFVYNTTPHTITKRTSHEILFGKKAIVPGQLQQQATRVYNYDDLVHDINRRMQECHKLARAYSVQSKQHRAAQQASKVNMSKFSVGDKVLLCNEKAGKLDPLWAGPFVIVETDSKLPNVVIELTTNRRNKVHVNRLKRYH